MLLLPEVLWHGSPALHDIPQRSAENAAPQNPPVNSSHQALQEDLSSGSHLHESVLPQTAHLLRGLPFPPDARSHPHLPVGLPSPAPPGNAPEQMRTDHFSGWTSLPSSGNIPHTELPHPHDNKASHRCRLNLHKWCKHPLFLSEYTLSEAHEYLPRRHSAF